MEEIMASTTGHTDQHATFTLDVLHCPECADAVEQALDLAGDPLPVATTGRREWAHNQVRVGSQAVLVTPKEIGKVMANTGGACERPDEAQEHAGHGEPSERQRLQGLQDAVDDQP